MTGFRPYGVNEDSALRFGLEQGWRLSRLISKAGGGTIR